MIVKGSIFNPFSNHGAVDHFKKEVSGGKQFIIVLATVFATLLTLPLLGIGGVATFRALTRKYSVIKLEGNSQAASPVGNANSSAKTNSPARSTNAPVGNVNAPVGKTAQKTQNQYIRAAKHFFETKGKKLIDDTGYSSLTTEEDTFFKIASESLGVPRKELHMEMKTFIEKNPEKVKEMFEKFPFTNVTLQAFKDSLLNENVWKTLINKNGEKDLILGVKLQICINQTRCDILSQIRDVKIVLHTIIINHLEGMRFINKPPGTLVSPDNISLATSELDTIVFGADKSKTIELVLGDVQYTKISPEYYLNRIFIQPRKLEEPINSASRTRAE